MSLHAASVVTCGYMASPAATQSNCGKCGYLVTGLPTFQCPECGSDLREVGIVKQEIKAAPRRFGMADLPREVRMQLTRTILFLASITSLAIVIIFFTMPTWSTTRYVDSFVPRSKSFSRLSLESNFQAMRMLGAYYDEHVKNVEVEVTIVGNDGISHRTSVNLPDMKMGYQANRASSWTWTRAFDQEEFLKWLKEEEGFDTSNPDIRKDAGELVALLKTYQTLPPVSWKEFRAGEKAELPSFNFSGFTSSTSLRAGSVIAVMSAGVVVYLLGVVRVVRKTVAESKAAMIAEGKWIHDPPAELPTTSRTLTVIFVDLKDFTGQAASISRAKLLALLRQQRQVVEKSIAPFDGRLIKTMGDGIIATFESATNAVLASLAIQTAARKASLELRIGITTGEVTVEAQDVYGPAVNVAARLQAAAGAGEVLFSEATHHSIHSAEVQSEDLGPTELKGVPAMVRVYRAKA